MALTIRRAGRNEIDVLEPLWSALREHHAQVAPENGPPRSREDSWARRRAQYEVWLAEPGAFALLAQFDESVVGYAMVRITRNDSPTWPLDEPIGEVETLAVLPGVRGAGVGSALLQAVRAALAEQGISEMHLFVVAANRDAIRFYERLGFKPFTIAFWAPVDEESA